MLSTASHNPQQSSPETARFLAWYEAEKKNGLVDVKFCLGSVHDATVELVFAEVNRAIAAETVDDPELI
jgi:hypothetical protein